MDPSILTARLKAVAEREAQPPAVETNIFESQYAARALLTELETELLQIFNAATGDVKKEAQGQLGKLYIELAVNLIFCKETSEGKEALEKAQSLLECSRGRTFFDFEADKLRRAKALLEAKAKAQKVAEMKAAAAKRGVNVESKTSADWLSTTSTDLEPVIESFPIPTTFGNVDYTHTDLLTKVYNQLAQQYSEWGEYLKAEQLLANAEKIYKDWAEHSPIKKAAVISESPASKPDTQFLVQQFKLENNALDETRTHERQMQQDALEAKLIARRKKKGISSTLETTAANVADEHRILALQHQQERLVQKAQNLRQKLTLEETITEDQRCLAANMEEQFLMTCYGIAQIHSRLDRPHQAAAWFQETMCRQLQLRKFDRTNWVSNCAHLANYYIGEFDLLAAEHCLLAADIFAPMIEEAEVLKTLALMWAKYHFRLLKLNRDVDEQALKMETTDTEGYLLLGPKTLKIKERPHVPKVCFSRLPINPPRQHIDLITTLSQAKELFTKAMDRYTEVIDFFDVDLWTETRIEMMQNLSTLHECLIYYEDSPANKLSLHEKRIPYLSDLLDKFENIIFTNTVRQFRFELGTVHVAMADILICQKLNDQANQQLQAGLAQFEQFTDSFKTEFDAQQKLKKASDRLTEFVLDEDYIQPYILGYCHLAQIHTKLKVSAEEQRANIDKALECYTHVLAFAKKCKLDKKACIRNEMNMCHEMAQLLPQAKLTSQIPIRPVQQPKTK
eukprot:NODE_389_length_2308_cov_46.775332_g360_i0.p1 GENE.NODE_389_length_2308_cov_46.775332_g360_i0~~NODE_389_length_2308_cov_46.775332_g360_i0.p1  ORF type:complete len:745 (+),score=225.62 NODE_389_length_2308_cov_46.775332_g360_i0:29-2236(+)